MELTSKAESPPVSDIPKTEAIALMEKRLTDNLEAVPTAARITVLIHSLAVTRLQALFGFVYANIFGSQLRLVRYLRAHRKVSNSEAQGFYETAVSQFPDQYKSYAYERWLEYLIDKLFVTKDGDWVVMTAIGDDFVLWLDFNNLSAEKPL